MNYTNRIFITKREAEEILIELRCIIREYGKATVDDYYDLAGIEYSCTYLLEKYGWTDLSGVNVIEDICGWKIDFPEPRSFDRRFKGYYKQEGLKI